MVPPTLQIRLAVVNKIVTALDAIVVIWAEKKNYKLTASSVSPGARHLAYALSCCGVRRKSYYSGQ